MPVYEITAPDGKTYEFDSPAPLDSAQQALAVQEVQRYAEQNATPSDGSFARDVPLSFAKGAVQGTRFVSDAFGADNAVSQQMGRAEEYLNSLMSAEAQNDQQKIAQIMEAAQDEGVWDQVKAGWEAATVSPSTLLAQGAGTVVPSLIGAKAALPLRGLGMTARGAGLTSSAATGTAMGAGIVKDTIYQGVEAELLKAGVPPEEAAIRAEEAQRYAGENADLIAQGAGLGGLAALTGLQPVIINSILGKGTQQAQRGIVRRTTQTAATEAVPEGIQGGQEQYAENVALQREGFDVPTERGVVGGATLEGLMGAGIGAGAGAVFSDPQYQPPFTPEPETAPMDEEAQYQQDIANDLRQSTLERADTLADQSIREDAAVNAKSAAAREAARKQQQLLRTQGIAVQPAEPLVQAGLDFDEPTVLDNQPQQPQGPTPQQEFEARPVEERIDALSNELARFDDLYGDLDPKIKRTIKKDLDDRLGAYEKEALDAAKARTKAEKAEYRKGVDYLRQRGSLSGPMTPQLAEAMGVNPRATKVMGRIIGEDMDSVEGRARVLEALEDYGASSLENNPLVNVLFDTVKTDVPGITDFRLQRQLQEDPEPQNEADMIADYMDLYNAARNRNDSETVRQLDLMARENVDPKEWGRAKAGMTRQRSKQERELGAFGGNPAGGRAMQPDLLEQARRRPPEQQEMFPDQDLGTAPERPAAPAQPVVESTATQPDLFEEPANAKTAQKPKRSNRNKQRKTADKTEQQTVSPSVEVSPEQPRGPTTPEGAASPEGGRVGDSEQPVSGPDRATAARNATLSRTWEEFDAAKDTAKKRGRKATDEEAAVDARPADSLGGRVRDIEEAMEILPEGSEERSDAVSMLQQLKDMGPPDSAVSGLTRKAAEALQEEVNRMGNKYRAPEVDETPDTITPEPRPDRPLGEGYARPPQDAPPLPATATEVGTALSDGLKTDTPIERVLDVAVDENYMSAIEAELHKELIANADDKVKARAKALNSVVTRVADDAYFRADPAQVRAMHELIRLTAEQNKDYEYSRGKGTGEPLSTKATLESKNKATLGKVNKVFKTNIVQSVTDLPGAIHPDDVQGLFYQGEIYLVADNILDADFNRVLAHEVVGHAGMETILGNGGFNSLVSQINTLKKNNKRVKAVLDNIKNSYTNPMGEYTLDARQEAREIIAHIAEAKSQYLSDGPIRSMWNNLVTKVNQWLAGLGLGDRADADLDRLIFEAAQYVNGGTPNIGKTTFSTPEFQSLHMMKRAWQQGYRGTDVDAAAELLRGVRDGSVKVPEPSMDGVDNMSADFTESIDYSVPTYSRGPGRGPAAGAQYDSVISLYTANKNNTPNRQEPAPQTLKGWGALGRRQFDKFRVSMVDKAATAEDKIMKVYNNALYTDDLGVNPMMSYVSWLRSEGVAAQVMRTGAFGYDAELDSWTGDPRFKTNNPEANMRNIMQIAAELGDRIGHDRAQHLINFALTAAREGELDLNNQKLEKQMKDLRLAGKYDAAEKIQERVVNLSYPEDVREEGTKLVNDVPEIKKIAKLFREHNNMMTDRMVEAGVISNDVGEEWKEHAAYVPFSRIIEVEDGESRVGGYQQSASSLLNLGTMRNLRNNTSREINDVLDNMARLTIWQVNSVMGNHAAKQLVRGLKQANAVQREIDNPKTPGVNRAAVVSYKENALDEDGQMKHVTRYFELSDPLDAHAFKGVQRVTDPVLGAMTSVADFLRKGVTLSPEFIASQLMQDSFRAYIIGGNKHAIKVPGKVLTGFFKVRKELSAGGSGDTALNILGISGMYDYSPSHTRQQIEAAYKGKDRNLHLGQKLFLWGERNAEASDLALRKALYDQTLAESGDRRLAAWKAHEIINFNRGGNSVASAVLRQIIPFQNAYLQGMNIMGKTLAGRGLTQTEKKQALATFVGAGLRVAALSAVYAMAMSDDDDYAAQASYVRSRNFLFPTGDDTPPIKLIMPPDLGFLFKAIPEAVVSEMVYDVADAKKTRTELKDAFVNAIMGPDLVPQIVKPTLEIATNYSFMRGSALIGLGEQNLPVEEQFRENTSQLGRAMGHAGISPIKFDHFISGTLGSLGGTSLLLSDMAIETLFGLNKTQRDINQLPMAKVFFAPKVGSGTRTDFYNMRDQVRGLVQAVNKAAESDPVRAKRLLDENEDLFVVKDLVNDIDRFMDKTNKAVKLIEADKTMDPAEKRAKVDEIRRAQNQMADAIDMTRRRAYEGQ